VIQPERPYPFQGLIAIIVIERLFRSVVSQVPKCEKNVFALDSDLGHRGSVGELTFRASSVPTQRAPRRQPPVLRFPIPK
jgi:hypothetical protein